MEDAIFEIGVELPGREDEEIVEVLVPGYIIEAGDEYVDENRVETAHGHDYDDSQHPLDLFLEEWVRDRDLELAADLNELVPTICRIRDQPWPSRASRLHDLARVLHATIAREPTAAEEARRRWEAEQRRRYGCDYASGVCATHGGPTTDKPLVLRVPKRQNRKDC